MSKKFIFDVFIDYHESKNYAEAMNYAQQFQGDRNADICLIYSKLLSGEYTVTSPEAKHNLLDAYQRYLKNSTGYDKEVLYLLGIMLDDIGCNTAAIEVLEKIKKYSKNSRIFLERFYIIEWQRTGDIEYLKKAADCKNNSKVCYLYADTISNDDPYLAEDYRDGAYKWEDYIKYSDYCIQKSEQSIADMIEELKGDVSKGFDEVINQTDHIKSMMNAFSDKFDSLEDKVMNKLEAGFEEVNNITKSMQALSAEQQSNASLVFDYLFEWRNAMEQNEEASAVRAKEITDKIIDLTNSVEKAEAKIQEQFDTITKTLVKNTFSKHDDPKLDDMVKSADIMINNRFGNQLDEEAKRSLVSAIFTLAFYKKLSKDSTSYTDFSGVAILATSALEIELNKRIYSPYLSFLKVKFYNNNQQYIEANKLRDIPAEITYKDQDDNNRHKFKSKLNLGSFPFITGCKGSDESNSSLNKQKCRELFVEFLKSYNEANEAKKLKTSYVYYLFSQKTNYSRMMGFSTRLEKVRIIRNQAAHSETVSESQAETVCVETFGTKGLAIAEQTNQDVLSLLDILINSVDPFNP